MLVRRVHVTWGHKTGVFFTNDCVATVFSKGTGIKFHCSFWVRVSFP